MPTMRNLTNAHRVLITAPFLFVALLFASSASIADLRIKTEKHEVYVRELIDGLHYPWSIGFINDTHWLITERSGQLRQVIDGELLKQPIKGLPKIAAKGQGGLLDVAVHPQFADNRLIYLSYAARGKGGFGTQVMRGRLKESRLEDVQVIFSALPKQGGGRHFGSRLLFDNDGFLFVSLGDRGDRPNGQDLWTHAGSVIRLNDDGSVPDSNPFVKNDDARPEIYSFGHRNVQGLTIDRAHNRLWAHEHGPQGGDELNILKQGANYGWPVITFGVNYGSGTKVGEGSQKAGMAQPRAYWVPSIAPSGLAFYNGDRFPKWQGNLFVGALKFQLIERIELDGERVIHQERFLTGALGRIRDVRTGPDGYIYLLTDDRNGKLYRLEPE